MFRLKVAISLHTTFYVADIIKQQQQKNRTRTAHIEIERATHWNTTINKRDMLIAQFTMKLEKMEPLEQQQHLE